MAKIKFGSMVSQASGSVSGVTFSHNRYGAYTRRRAIPVKSVTVYALAAKGRLAQASQAWGLLQPEGRAAWRTWAQTNPVTDALGDSQVLTGHAAFVQLNCRLTGHAETAILVPPVGPPPLGLQALAGTFDIGSGDFELTWDNDPLGGDEHAEVWAAVVDETGRAYVENLYKMCAYGAAATTSGFDTSSDIALRFGTLMIGQYVFIKARVFNDKTGLVSGWSVVQGVVIDTP